MQSHEKNGTWELRPRSEVPPGTPVLRDRWAYDDKLSAGGASIERFKARLTAMGCFQKAGVDYTDAPSGCCYSYATVKLLTKWTIGMSQLHSFMPHSRRKYG
jgi:hypothetical protein